jgi:hypothetical protein
VDKLPKKADVKMGDLVIYKSLDLSSFKECPEHSATVIKVLQKRDKTDIEVLSKLGSGGEYFHNYLSVPSFYGNIVEVWTDRYII